MTRYEVIGGLDKFADHFAAFSENYIIVGGTACYLQLKDAGASFRSTKDIDMIITVEEITKEFGLALKQFIKNGGYKVYINKKGKPQFFRFEKPEDTSYPYMIELFSRKQDIYSHIQFDKFTPINVGDDLSSLSAILLDDDYYAFLKKGRDTKQGLSVLKSTHLIAFKARAYLDLSKKRKNGVLEINSRNINKHKKDIFRLSQLLKETDTVDAGDNVKKDILDFLQLMETEQIDMGQIGAEGITQQEATSVIRSVFGL